MRRAYVGGALVSLLVLVAACGDRQPVAPSLLTPRADSLRLCGENSEEACVIEPISGTIDPKKPTEEGGDHDGGVGDGGGGDAGGGGGGGGGSGGTSPDDPLPGDTIPSDTACRATGDTLVDKTQVQDVFQRVWDGSNADARDQWQRRERGGWILKTAAGYAFQEFTDWRSEPCQLVPPSLAALSSPDNAVAWIHSHPFTYGEAQISCKYVSTITGLMTVPTYRGVPSVDDGRVGELINDRRSARGLGPIDGFVIDKEGILRFVPLTGGAMLDYPTIDRCAY